MSRFGSIGGGALFLAAAALVGYTFVTGAPPQVDAPRVSAPAAVSEPTTPASPSTYSREAFQHWSDLDGDGCDAREDALVRDVVGGGKVVDCLPVSGTWVSPYDGVTTTDPSEFDIDHIVPLKEAWDSGASEWSDERRQEFANDPVNLISVSAASNRSKGAKDPSKWMPPAEGYACEYVTAWKTVKDKYGLTVDDAEQKAVAAAC